MYIFERREDETSVELEQKQILKLSQEMKLSFSVLSMSYDEVLKFWLGKIEGSRQSTEDSFFESLSQEEDFFQYLENQLMYLEVSENIRQKLIFCIHSLNEAGFLELSDDELRLHLGISQKNWRSLSILWELEPVGVGLIILKKQSVYN
ncbi:RNA polymerase factor sigma-54 [Fusobacterium necrophorum subsp. necrophorum]|nr:RNA polymerase factor sigma-54 [Fusobacterium necrophorum subsp. necrophorum]